jgi:hemerythrin-like domain-containing protein
MSDSPSLILLEPAPGPDDPLGMLRACHRRLEAKLDTLTRVIEVYQQGDEERYDQAAGAIGLVIRHLHGPAQTHHEDEELSLFPRMIARDPAIAERLHALELEHETLAVTWRALLPQLLSLADGTPAPAERLAAMAEAVATLNTGYRAHIRAEDTVIYPAAQETLSAAELAAVGDEMAARRHLV